LVAALETLMPESAERALIRFDSGLGLELTMPKMRSITETIKNGEDDTPTEKGGTAPQYEARTRQETESLIAGVEAFFHSTEPSSPVPMLLAKAKTFMNRDFSAILNELIKNDSQNPPS
jgi:type VI secretion system protein ImpA